MTGQAGTKSPTKCWRVARGRGISPDWPNSAIEPTEPQATAAPAGGRWEVHRLLGAARMATSSLVRPSPNSHHVDDPRAGGVRGGTASRDATGESVQVREGTSRVCVAALEPAAGLRSRLLMTAGLGAKAGPPTPPLQAGQQVARCGSAPERWPRCAGRG